MPTAAARYFADFNPLAELALSYRSAKPILVAAYYDLFTWIERGYGDSERLARRLNLDVRGVALVLEALVALGQLNKTGRRYRNTPASRRLLVASSPAYIGSNLRYQEHTWEAWSDLRHVVKHGRPRSGLLDWVRKDFFTADYIRAMGDVTREPARELAQKLGLAGVLRTLDVGCGAGTYSAAFVQASSRLRADLFDLPRTIPIIRRLLRGSPGFDRMHFRPGNYLTDRLGREEYDLILISGVTRVEDERGNRGLIRNAIAALRPGGRLVVHDYVIEPDRPAPTFSALLNLHLLLFTGKGRVYSVREYARWMHDARLTGVRAIRIASESLHPSFAVVGRKPAH